MESEYKVVRCQECGEEFNGKDAYSHVIATGHNRWELISPHRGEGEGE